MLKLQEIHKLLKTDQTERDLVNGQTCNIRICCSVGKLGAVKIGGGFQNLRRCYLMTGFSVGCPVCHQK